MSKDEAVNLATRIIERWGFPVLVACFLGWSLRADIVLPMVDAHVRFLDEMTQTQREIVETMQEQTRLLYALQPRTAAYNDTQDVQEN